jgi:hypothetical protein
VFHQPQSTAYLVHICQWATIVFHNVPPNFLLNNGYIQISNTSLSVHIGLSTRWLGGLLFLLYLVGWMRLCLLK